MSLVDLGKRLLEAARKGQDDEVRNLMANGAPFTTDWVSLSGCMACSSPRFHGDVMFAILSQKMPDEQKKIVCWWLESRLMMA